MDSRRCYAKEGSRIPERNRPKTKKRRPKDKEARSGGRVRLKRSYIVVVIILVAASIGGAVWFMGSKAGCVVHSDQIRAEVEPTRLVEVPDYALEIRIRINNTGPCNLHLMAINTKILNATFGNGTTYKTGIEDSQSIDSIIKPGQDTEVEYLFPPLERRPTSVSVTVTLNFEGLGEVRAFEGQIVVP